VVGLSDRGDHLSTRKLSAYKEVLKAGCKEEVTVGELQKRFHIFNYLRLKVVSLACHST
jgi:hypothetical protein